MPSERIRVLGVVADLNFGGGENRLINIARSIDSERFSYRVATLYSPSADLVANYGSLQPALDDAGIAVTDLGLPRPGRGTSLRPLKIANTAWALSRAALLLRRYLLSARIDVLDAHLDATLLVGGLAARAACVPMAVTLYHAEATDHAGRLRGLRRAGLRAADAIFTDSRSVASDLTKFIGGERPPVYVVPNGVRLPAPKRSRSAVLAELEIPSSAKAIIGQISGLVPSKGHMTLLRAARRVIDERPGTYFIFIGYDRENDGFVESLWNEARALGIAEWLRIQPYAGSVEDVWQVIDLHVHASEFDSLPNAIIEGMSLGKPAVVTAVGGIPDLVANKRTGLVVAPRDPAAIADALLRLLMDPASADRMGQAAYERYLERCTPEVTVRQLEQRFTELHERRAMNRGHHAVPSVAHA